MKSILKGKRLTGKFHLTRWGIVALAVVVALGSIGITYASLSGQGKGKGNVVHTDYFSDPFSWVVSNDSGQVDDPAIDSDDTGPDPKAPQSIGENTCDRYDKDVASTTAALDGLYNIVVTVSNAYPSYYPTIFYGIINDGTVTGGIDSITVDENFTGEDDIVDDDIPELTVTVGGIAVDQEVEAGEEVTGNLAIHVEQCAAENAGRDLVGDPAAYTIRVKIVCSVTECGECEGQVTMLTLKYTGTEAALIKVVQTKKPRDEVFEDTVQSGAKFSFYGTTKQGTLGPAIEIFVNDGTIPTIIHTSCSQPIGPGLVAGDFLVVYGESRNGGKLCPLPPLPPLP